MSDEVKKVDGKWRDKKISLKSEWGGHAFTDEEITKLFKDETITFEAIAKNGNTYTVSGKLEEQEYEGKKFVSFKPNFENNDAIEKFEGIWKDHPISVKREWGGHRFTDEEVQNLLNGKTIEFKAISKSGNSYTAKGKLEKQEYNGNTFIGFKPIFEEKKDDVDRYEGTWNGRTVRFKKDWGGHHFTIEECEKLINGEVIEFSAVSKGGKSYIARGALAEQEYNGNKYVGFKLNFNG